LAQFFLSEEAILTIKLEIIALKLKLKLFDKSYSFFKNKRVKSFFFKIIIIELKDV
jgi:hypothetical protein